MSKILTDLRSLVGAPVGSQTGIVTEVTSTSVIVSTPSGRKEFSVPNTTLYNPGVKVKYQGDLLIGRLPSQTDLAVYNV